MTIKQERKLSMFLSVASLRDDATDAIIDSVPKLGDGFDVLLELIVSMQGRREIQELNLEGIAKKKSVLEDELVFLATGIAGKVRAYAVNEENHVLEGEVDYTKTVLKQSPDTILRDRCQVIHNRAAAFLGELAEYGVSVSNLEVLQAAIDGFKAVLPLPREGIADKKGATSALVALFRKTDALLRKMDVLVEVVREDHGDFYRSYKNHRLLTDAGFRKLPMRGRVVDEEGNPIGNVVVQVEGMVKCFLTTAKGNFRVQTMKAGKYTLRVSKFGFVEVKVKVVVRSKERCEVFVVLKRN